MGVAYNIIPIVEAHRPWLAEVLTREWGSPRIISRGKSYNVLELPGFIAVRGDEWVGAVTYVVAGNEREVMTINSVRKGEGVGTALLNAVQAAARASGCRRVWLVTTNDNTMAQAFYEKRGFRLANIYPNAMDEARRLKPEIPLIGHNGIPIRDELEYERMLS